MYRGSFVAPPETLPRQRHQIALYFGLLMLSLGLADPLGIVNLPVLYMLKDTLGLRPPAVALFEAIMLLPVCLGFLFGFLRDRWSLPGWGDRGYLMLAAPVAVCGYVWLATHPVSYAGLLVAALVIMVAFQFMDTAAQAMFTVVAQRHHMTGRLSALSEIIEVAPRILALLVGGWLVANANSPMTFLAAAMITTAIAVQGLWRPRAIFAADATSGGASESGRAALHRLLRHKPLRPTIVILLLWNFAPGWGTPFLYYLSEDVGLSSQAFGVCKAVNLGCIAITAVLYGFLCQHQPLRRMLWWGVCINIPPGALFLLIGSAPAAIAVSAIVGLACGLGNIAVFDLLLRSCPKNLEGSATMLGFAALTAADAGADLLGSVLYEHGGLVLCLVLDALATLCILPFLARLPAAMVDTQDRNPEESPVQAPRTFIGSV